MSTLITTRRENEEIVIGDPANPVAVVRVASIRGDRVRLAVEADRELPVHRREVAEQVLAEIASGARTSPVGCSGKPCAQAGDNKSDRDGCAPPPPPAPAGATDRSAPTRPQPTAQPSGRLLPVRVDLPRQITGPTVVEP